MPYIWADETAEETAMLVLRLKTNLAEARELLLPFAEFYEANSRSAGYEQPSINYFGMKQYFRQAAAFLERTKP